MLQTTGLSSTPVNLCRYDAVIHCTLMSHTLLGIHAADSHCSEAWWGLPAGRKSVLGTSPLPGDFAGTCAAECPDWFLIYPRNQRDFHQCTRIHPCQRQHHVVSAQLLSLVYQGLDQCWIGARGAITPSITSLERRRGVSKHDVIMSS